MPQPICPQPCNPCLDPADPLSNYSSEGPDDFTAPEIHYGCMNKNGCGDPRPPIHWPPTCESDQSVCSEPDPTCFDQPWFPGCSTSSRYSFCNHSVTCFVTCPDGGEFENTVLERTICATSQAQADWKAYNLACKPRFCLRYDPLICTVDEPTDLTAKIVGGNGPFQLFVVGGVQPPGLFTSLNGRTVHFKGVPLVAGTFHVELSIHDLEPGGGVLTTFVPILVLPVPCPKPVPISWLCPSNSSGKKIAWNSAALPIVYVDSISRVFVPGDAIDAFHTFAVMDFTGGAAVLERYIDGPNIAGAFPGIIPTCSIYDAANDQVIAVTRARAFVPIFPGTLEYENRLCFFKPDGTFTSIVLEAQGVATSNAQGIIVKVKKKYALLFKGVSGTWQTLYMIDPVAKTITSSVSLIGDATRFYEGILTYACNIDRLVLNYLDLATPGPPLPHPNRFLLVDPHDLALGGTNYLNPASPDNCDEIVYIDSLERILAPNGGAGNVSTWNPADGSDYRVEFNMGNVNLIYSTTGLPQGIFYNFTLDALMIPLRNYDLPPGVAGRGEVRLYDMATMTLKCTVTRPEWPDGNFGEYPTVMTYRAVDGLPYVHDFNNFVLNYVLELQ